MNALFDLTGKTALVTGSARGLGFAYAEGLAAAGARVILNDIRDTLLAESVDTLTIKGYDAQGVAFDVTDEQAIEAAFSKLDAEGISVDILINNAGCSWGDGKKIAARCAAIRFAGLCAVSARRHRPCGVPARR